MPHYLVPLIILFLSCGNKQNNTISTIPSIDSLMHQTDTVSRTVKTTFSSDTSEIVVFFVDSMTVGKKALNKIEISKFVSEKSNYTIVKFYAKQKKWILKNDFRFNDETLISFEPRLSDFNNDGFNDITYVSRTAARGANEIRKLFIYDKLQNKLIYLKNSEDYPNMLYNKELNCIDAFLVYGGCSTVFLKIRGDSLTEFACVELNDGLTISTYDKSGKAKIIFQDTTNKADFIRYKNFKPLKESDEY